MAKAVWETRPDSEKNEMVTVWRLRLSDLSWMMRALNERIARRANKEDDCTGRFWEGRFSSQPLLDEAGLLTCMAYVDLNPVRAGLCHRLEDAAFTSVQERLKAAGATSANPASFRRHQRTTPVPDGLMPFADQNEELLSDGGDQVAVLANVGDSSTEQPSIPMRFVDYVDLLEWTAHSEREPGPFGTLRGDGDAPALLTQLRFNSHGWLAAMKQHGIRTRCALGRMDRAEAFSKTAGRTRLTGRSLIRSLLL